jgi:hypothetical protein
MQIVRVKLANLWFTPSGKRYRKGEHYLPYEVLRCIPTSAEILPDDDHIKALNHASTLAQAEADLEYWTANPGGYDDAEIRVAGIREHLARLRGGDAEQIHKHNQAGLVARIEDKIGYVESNEDYANREAVLAGLYEKRALLLYEPEGAELPVAVNIEGDDLSLDVPVPQPEEAELPAAVNTEVEVTLDVPEEAEEAENGGENDEREGEGTDQEVVRVGEGGPGQRVE